jgi:hypothetical protein
LADRLGVPGQLVRDLPSPQALLDGLEQAIQGVAADQVGEQPK